MGLLVSACTRLRMLCYLAENPRLIPYRMRGGSLGSYQKLSSPWLKNLGLRTILDIGANTGQFAIAASQALPTASVVSFEPLPDCYEKLSRRLRNKPLCSQFNLAIGDQAGELPFERSSFAQSSSFLKMTDAHKNAFPESRDSEAVRVKVVTLDDFARTHPIQEPFLVKIDVQGYEDRVLNGGRETLSRAKLLFLETSFEVLYEGQPLFCDLYRKLTDWGFQYIGAMEQLENPGTGRVLQADSIFIKP